MMTVAEYRQAVLEEGMLFNTPEEVAEMVLEIL